MLNVQRVEKMAARRLKSEIANKMATTIESEGLVKKETPISEDRRPLNVRPPITLKE